MKILFVCYTEFQLLTALNMKFHVYKDDIVDIVVDNYHGEEPALAKRIVETGLFRHVCYFDTHTEYRTLHAYFRGISDGNKTSVSICEALKNTCRFIWSRMKSMTNGDEGYLSVLVKGFRDLDATEYDIFCAFAGKPVVKRLRSYVENKNSKCKIIQLDEGLGSYLTLDVGHNSNVDGCILYNPSSSQLAVKTERIPGLLKNDKDFIDVANKVFNFDDSKCVDFCDSIIIFDGGVHNPMPRYLRNASWLKQIIFHNAYRRHKIEAEKYEHWKKITLEIFDELSGKDVWVKPHPRSSEKALELYSDIPDIKIMPQYWQPWELIALNCEVKRSMLVAGFSSSVCLYPSVVQPLGNIANILFYKRYGFSITENAAKYIEDLCETYPEMVFAPKDKGEFLKIISEKFEKKL